MGFDDKGNGSFEHFNTVLVVGLDENVTIIDTDGKEIPILAKVDTGADCSSIDKSIYDTLHSAIISSKKIRSASGTDRRDVTQLKVRIKEKELFGNFNIADRSMMKFKMLIGKNILKEGFLIDPSKSTVKK
ncbi:MAG: RimK/LysX family protein [Candidatus Woesearchaeota archaeon]|jgi:hypothetical protein